MKNVFNRPNCKLVEISTERLIFNPDEVSARFTYDEDAYIPLGWFFPYPKGKDEKTKVASRSLRMIFQKC